jgi:type I restriction enzyme M protein
MITGALKSQVDRLWTTFWNNGISNPLTVIEQISYLLFIKRLDDLEIVAERKARRLGRPLAAPRFGAHQQHLRWSVFKNTTEPAEQYKVVSQEVFPFIKNLHGEGATSSYARHMKDAAFMIGSPALLANVVEQVEAILTAVEAEARQEASTPAAGPGARPRGHRDIMGDLYEYMLSKLATAGQNGQFRTPRHIVKMMVDLVEPTPQDVICDPACGTAGFLVTAAEALRPQVEADPVAFRHFNEGMFHGFDFDATMLRIGSMNMMLHGVENPRIDAADSLSNDRAGIRDTFSLVLANPPFKGSVDMDLVAEDLLKALGLARKRSNKPAKEGAQKEKGPAAKTELLFLALILRALKVGGRAAVIVPDGVLFGSTGAHKKLRKALVEDHRLQGVVSMPAGVFKPYAGVSTAVLLFTRTGAGCTDQVWFYDMTADGLSLDDKRQPVEQNDIPDVLARWRGRDPAKDTDRKGKAFFVPKAEIVKNQWDLSINRYKEVVLEKVEYEAPGVILTRLAALEDEIQRGIGELRGLVG